jgi:cytochrome P450
MYELSKHPEIVTKLRAEILERLGPVTAPTYEDLKDMKYTQHLLQETLRLYPASKASPLSVEYHLLF